jgi:hypothetical protein
VENPKYDGSTPGDAQKHLQKVWARIRAKLARHGITLYGFRVAEPNHDGCVHWHLLVFAPGWCLRRIRWTFRDHALRDSPNERGAQKHRVTFVEIDPAKGTAAGYIAKYIAKNIDGHALDQDLFGGDPIEAAARVDAWASCWGIRQFQQLGGPPVTVWRELRRIEGEESGVLETARDSADRGDWAAFVQTMGGPTCPRQSHPVKLAKATDLITFDEKTGEVAHTSPALNKYGEPAAAQIIGVACDGQITATRWHVWDLKRERSDRNRNRDAFGVGVRAEEHLEGLRGYAGGDIHGRGLSGASYHVVGLFERLGVWEGIANSVREALADPWSSVNNCTQQSCEGARNDESSNITSESIRVGMENYPDVYQSGGRWSHHGPGNRRNDTGGS